MLCYFRTGTFVIFITGCIALVGFSAVVAQGQSVIVAGYAKEPGGIAIPGVELDGFPGLGSVTTNTDGCFNYRGQFFLSVRNP